MTIEKHTHEMTSTELETISGGLIAGGSVASVFGSIVDASVNQGVNVNSAGAIAQGPGAFSGGYPYFPWLRF